MFVASVAAFLAFASPAHCGIAQNVSIPARHAASGELAEVAKGSSAQEEGDTSSSSSSIKTKRKKKSRKKTKKDKKCKGRRSSDSEGVTTAGRRLAQVAGEPATVDARRRIDTIVTHLENMAETLTFINSNIMTMTGNLEGHLNGIHGGIVAQYDVLQTHEWLQWRQWYALWDIHRSGLDAIHRSLLVQNAHWESYEAAVRNLELN